MGWLHPPFAAAAVETGWRKPFTASQWRELELQALIYRYLAGGVPVPTDLLLPIHRSLQSSHHHYPAPGYCSYYGKKVDPEPWRCRRTDGKKWRCSKEAHLESKYCERHMHRNRNRSRKPVESKSSSSSTVTSNVRSGRKSFQNITMQSTMTGVCSGSSGSSLLQLDATSYVAGSKESRNFEYLDGAKVEVDEQNFFSESSGSSRDGLKMTSSSSDSLLFGHSQHHLPAIQHLNETTINLMPKQSEQSYSFADGDYSSLNKGKQKYQSFGHFFGWTKVGDSWLNLVDEQSKQNSSTTQLSISIPLASDFSSTTSCSANGASFAYFFCFDQLHLTKLTYFTGSFGVVSLKIPVSGCCREAGIQEGLPGWRKQFRDVP